jgi:hypothetical protein
LLNAPSASTAQQRFKGLCVREIRECLKLRLGATMIGIGG